MMNVVDLKSRRDQRTEDLKQAARLRTSAAKLQRMIYQMHAKASALEARTAVNHE